MHNKVRRALLFNRYIYVTNNPLRWKDRFGLCREDIETIPVEEIPNWLKELLGENRELIIKRAPDDVPPEFKLQPDTGPFAERSEAWEVNFLVEGTAWVFRYYFR